METVHIKINGTSYEVAAGSTILEAAHSVGIEIPTLCYLKEINEIGACRICVVEVKARAPGHGVCVPCQRGHGSRDQQRKGAGVPQDEPGAAAFHARPELPVLRAQHRLRAAAALPRLRRERPALCRQRASGMPWTIPRRIWCATTTSASCAAAAWPPARQPGRGCDRPQRARLLHAHRLRV